MGESSAWTKEERQTVVGWACIAVMAVAACFLWGLNRKQEKLAQIYVKEVHPFVNESLNQLSWEEKAAVDIAKYEHLHAEACRLSNQLSEAASDGERSHRWSDEECIELMYKTRPYAQKLKDESNQPRRPAVASSANQAPSPEKDLKAYFLKSLGGYSVENYCAMVTLEQNMNDCIGTFKQLSSMPGGLERSTDEAVDHAIQSEKLDTPDKVDEYVRGRKRGAGLLN